MSKNLEPVKVRCAKCREWFNKMEYRSKDISSFSFPQYRIQRYKDFESKPQEINLCTKCSDKLDRFLYIYTDGKDYYRTEENNTTEEPGNE